MFPRSKMLVVMGGGIRYGAPITVTLTPASVTVTDGEVRDGASATTNYGASGVVLGVGEWNGGASVRRTLIKFDLSAIPADAVVISAALQLYCLADNSSNARTFRVYRQLRAWVEAQCTWNIYSTGNNWQTAGGFGAADCEQTDIGSRDMTATETLNEYKSWTLTPAKVEEWIDGTLTNNGMFVKADTETDDMYQFASSEAVDANTHPKFVLTYKVPL